MKMVNYQLLQKYQLVIHMQFYWMRKAEFTHLVQV